MSLTTVKAFFRTVIKVVAGGPTNLTRGTGLLGALDALAEEVYSRLKMRGPYSYPATYDQYDVVTVDGAAYFRAGASFTASGAFDATKWVAFAASSDAGGPARVQLITDQGKRVAVLAVESNSLVVSDVTLFDHAAALKFQLNIRVAGDWIPGPQLTVANLNTAISDLTEEELAEGVELEMESQVDGGISAQFLALFTITGLSGTATLQGTRGARRVYNPNSSPEPATGLAFNTGSASTQSFSFPNPALSVAGLSFWMRRDTAAGTGNEYWLVSGRNANNVYFVANSVVGMTAYVEGVSRATSLDGSPVGEWVRVMINFVTPLQAGTISICSSTPGNGYGPLNTRFRDMRFYSRNFTSAEYGDRESGPTDSLLARFNLPFDQDTTNPVVLDESGNGNNGTLHNF